MCNGKTNLRLCGGGEVGPNIRGRLYILDKMVEVLNAIILGNFNLNLLVHNSDNHDIIEINCCYCICLKYQIGTLKPKLVDT